jgi:uncharacterized protein with GYD domain
MPHFLHQVAYTSEAMARLIANPQNRFDAVRGPIEKLGGRVEAGYLAFGEFDVVVITEFPDTVSAAAIAMAFAAGGAVKSERTTLLITAAEGVEALKKAATCGYKSVTAGASAARP